MPEQRVDAIPAAGACATRHDRHGAELQTQPADRRRADDGDRRHHQAQVLALRATCRPSTTPPSSSPTIRRDRADGELSYHTGRVMEEGPVDDIFHAPKHPARGRYARSQASMARLGSPAGDCRHSAASLQPSTGCPFHPRCPMMARCRRTPSLQPVGPASWRAALHHDKAEPA
jgi:hypothetical protein